MSDNIANESAQSRAGKEPPTSGSPSHPLAKPDLCRDTSRSTTPRRRGKDKRPRQVQPRNAIEYPKQADARGYAVLWNGPQRYFLGTWGTLESYNRFGEVLLQITSAQADTDRSSGVGQVVTVNELIIRYRMFAEDRYVKDDEPTSEISIVNWVCKDLSERFGDILVDEFTPLHLIEIRDAWKERCARSSVAKAMAKIRGIFKFGVARLLVKPETHTRLMAVEGLRKHQGIQPEPVQPVDDSIVEKTLPKLKPIVRAMIELQRLTGMRPGEACSLHVADLQRLENGVLVYSPESHKTEHHGIVRRIPIGPKAESAASEWLARAAVKFAASGEVEDGFVFVAGGSQKAKRRGHATVEWYRKQIHKGCDKAKVERWSPNQLRHTAGTEFRKEHGLDVARAILGHRESTTTEIYAERDLELAIEAMKRVG